MSGYDALHRRVFSSTNILDLGQHRRQDEARRLRDLLARFVIPFLSADRRMPDDEQIARQLHCSRNTARLAMQMLADEHLIERMAGVGTYAHTEPSVWRSDRLVDPFLVLSSAEKRGSRVIGWRVGPDIPDPMRAEVPATTDRLAIFEKVLFYDGRPGSLRTYYMPLRPDDEFTVQDAAHDIFEILEDRFGQGKLRAERRITALAADQSAAQLLEAAVGDPLLFIETVVRNASGAVVLSYYGRQRTDVVQVSLEPERLVDD